MNIDDGDVPSNTNFSYLKVQKINQKKIIRNHACEIAIGTFQNKFVSGFPTREIQKCASESFGTDKRIVPLGW